MNNMGILEKAKWEHNECCLNNHDVSTCYGVQLATKLEELLVTCIPASEFIQGCLTLVDPPFDVEFLKRYLPEFQKAIRDASRPDQPSTELKIEYKCPHCGWVYSPDYQHGYDGLVPSHNFPIPATRQYCPGSKQNPRGLADRRPLWKDEK